MEWRITKTNSGYHAEYGGYVEPGQEQTVGRCFFKTVSLFTMEQVERTEN